jgi:transcriptional regulator with XRE-family HTH domain
MRNIDFKAIGKKIREIRISKGLTQEYIANMVNVNTSHISNIENNRVKISLTILVGICNAIGTTVDYILSNEYCSSDSSIDNEILKELKSLDKEKKETALRIIKVL